MSKRKIITRRIVQGEPSEHTVVNRSPDLIDYVANKIHPVVGVAHDILQSKGKPFQKIESEPSGLGETISQQVQDINDSVKDIIKKNVKVTTYKYPKVKRIRPRVVYPVIPEVPKQETTDEVNPYKDLVDEH